MARDRKRAKQRQRRSAERQPTPVPGHPDPDGAPSPLEDSSAEVEIAEAAMVDPPEAELEVDELPPAADDIEEDAFGRSQPARRGQGDRPSRGPGAELPQEGNRFANFLRASAAELRRVQWPDRRQVAQATGVVLGFVIIAGAYLGLLDAIWSRVINAIL